MIILVILRLYAYCILYFEKSWCAQPGGCAGEVVRRGCAQGCAQGLCAALCVLCVLCVLCACAQTVMRNIFSLVVRRGSAQPLLIWLCVL